MIENVQPILSDSLRMVLESTNSGIDIPAAILAGIAAFGTALTSGSILWSKAKEANNTYSAGLGCGCGTAVYGGLVLLIGSASGFGVYGLVTALS